MALQVGPTSVLRAYNATRFRGLLCPMQRGATMHYLRPPVLASSRNGAPEKYPQIKRNVGLRVFALQCIPREVNVSICDNVLHRVPHSELARDTFEESSNLLVTSSSLDLQIVTRAVFSSHRTMSMAQNQRSSAENSVNDDRAEKGELYTHYSHPGGAALGHRKSQPKRSSLDCC